MRCLVALGRTRVVRVPGLRPRLALVRCFVSNRSSHAHDDADLPTHFQTGVLDVEMEAEQRERGREHAKDALEFGSADSLRSIYKGVPTSQLVFSWFILRLCSIDVLTDAAPRLVSAMRHFPFLSDIMFRVIEKTFYRQFCAGPDVVSSLPVVTKLGHRGVGSILDYSAESGDGDFDAVAAMVEETVMAGKGNKDVTHSCFKATGLTRKSLLEKVSQRLLAGGKAPPLLREGEAKGYTPDEVEEWQRFMTRLHRIGDCARDAHTPVLIDAEETWLQPAIDWVALSLARKYNKQMPLMYQTYQLYRTDAVHRLIGDIEIARVENWNLGAKLVRGAYMETERALAEKEGRPSPIWSTKEETDAAYDQALQYCIDAPNVWVAVATHNEWSNLYAVDMLRKRSPTDRVTFCQLYGMSDHISFALARQGWRVSKYVPFGPVGEVIPYLLRRLQENRGVVIRAAEERSMLMFEVKRRWFGHDGVQDDVIT